MIPTLFIATIVVFLLIVLLAIVMDRVTQAYGGRFIRADGRS